MLELLTGERDEDARLRGGEGAGDLDVVETERQDRVEALALTVLECLDLDSGRGRDVEDLEHLLGELLRRFRVGVDEAREVEEMLLLALELVQQVLGLLAGVADLGGQDRVVVALLDCLLLLLDDFRVNPHAALLDEVDGLRLLDGLEVPADFDRDGHVDQVRDDRVLERGVVLAHDEHLAVHVVHLEVGGRPVRLEVDAHRADEVLRGVRVVERQVIVAERELLAGAEQRMDGLEALDAAHGLDGAADLLEVAGEVGVDAREAPIGLLRVVGMDADGEVAGALDVGDALGQLLGQHLVHRLGVLLEDVVLLRLRVVETAVAELVGPKRRVNNAELDGRVRREIVVDVAHRGEDDLLVVVAGVLVGDVVELERLGVVALLDLADAVLVHLVVADGVRRIRGGIALLALRLRLLVGGGAALLELLRHVGGALRLLALGLSGLRLGVADLPLLALELLVELLVYLLHVALALALAHLGVLRVEREAEVLGASPRRAELLQVLEAFVFFTHRRSKSLRSVSWRGLRSPSRRACRPVPTSPRRSWS